MIAIATGQATAKTTTTVLNANCFPAAAGGRAMLGLGRRPIRIKIVRLYIATARLCPATVFGDCHCLNDRAAKNPAPVGAAIGRPSADRREIK